MKYFSRITVSHAEFTVSHHTFGIIRTKRGWEIISSKPQLDGHLEPTALRAFQWARWKLTPSHANYERKAMGITW